MSCKNPEARRAYHRKYMAERRAFFRAHHLCTECGREDAYTLAGRPRCFEHSHYRRHAPIEYIEPEKPPRVIPDRRLPGRCHMCGAPWMDGVTKWGGEPVRLCERCYNNLLRAGEKGRAAYKEAHGATWGQEQFEIQKRRNVSGSTARSSRRRKS